MKSYLDHPTLGPWKENSIIAQLDATPPIDQIQIQEHEQYGSTTNKNNQLVLPRIRLKQQQQLKNQSTKAKLNILIKMKPLQLEFDNSIRSCGSNQLKQARKQKTAAFQPPLISFYNKNHPKVAKKRYGGKYTLDESSGERSHRMNNINLLCEDIDDKRKGFFKSSDYSTGKKRKTSQYQFAKKRSLIQVLKFIKNNTQQKTQNQSQKQKLLLSKIEKYQELEFPKSMFDCYISSSKKPGRYRRY